MTLAITLMIVGLVSVVIGLILGFSGLRKFANSGLNGEITSPFNFCFLLAMIFDFLGGISFLVGLIMLVIALVKG